MTQSSKPYSYVYGVFVVMMMVSNTPASPIPYRAVTCESTRLSARDDKLESEGSRSRRCVLAAEPSETLPPSVVELDDFSVAIADVGPWFVEAERASIVLDTMTRTKLA